MNRNAHAPRVALLVDNPFRDLPGIVLIARALARRGAHCLLVPTNLRNAELWPLMPDFVLLNHLRRIYGNLARELTDCGIRAGVLDTEGGVYSPAANVTAGALADENQDLDEFAVSMVQEPDTRNSVALFCSWSARFAVRAAEKGWFNKEQLVVTGVPRMDLYASPWSEAALKLVPEAEAYAHNLILINSTFPLANAAYNSPENELEMLCKEIGYTLEYGKQVMAAQQEGMIGLTTLANRLAEKLPQATFVFRPHPFEREDVYRSLLKPLPNLHLVKKGTVNGWLLQAKALIQLGSSTAIDATLAGIPAFGPGWLPAFPPVPSVSAVTVRCTDEAEMRAQIEAVLAGRFVMPAAVQGAIAAIAEGTFYRIDGRAHERVADAILESLARRAPRLSRRACWNLTMKAPKLSLWDRIAQRRSVRAGRRYQAGGVEQAMQRAKDWDSSSKQFNVADVRRIADAIEAAAASRGDPAQPLIVADAKIANDYLLPAPGGRAVVLRAA